MNAKTRYNCRKRAEWRAQGLTAHGKPRVNQLRDELLPYKWDRTIYKTAYMRLVRGWPIEALGLPKQQGRALEHGLLVAKPVDSPGGSG